MTTAPETLRSARQRIAGPSRWLHGGSYNATDATDRDCAPWSALAVRWDLLGALFAVDRDPISACYFLARALGLREQPIVAEAVAIYAWHEAPERTHAQVLVALDRAIVLAEGDASTWRSG